MADDPIPVITAPVDAGVVIPVITVPVNAGGCDGGGYGSNTTLGISIGTVQ